MKIGAMNHPKKDPVSEIEWMARLGLDFIDLTLEPPASAPWQVDVRRIRRALDFHHMEVIGHTAYYLPIGHPFEEVRQGAVREMIRCLHTFAEIGACCMNIHPDSRAPFHDRSYIVKRNIESIQEVIDASRSTGLSIMVENTPGTFNSAEQLGELLDPLPDLMLHLDIGHTNLLVQENTTESILSAYSHRLAHVHLHDNRGGGDDLHLPLGTGTLETAKCIESLRRTGFDGTITLEVFSTDMEYLRHSAVVLRNLWHQVKVVETPRS